MNMQQRTIILARVSSKGQEDEGYSLDSQVKFLRGYCEQNELQVIKEFKLTETASKQDRRVVFKELLSFISKHKVYHFVVEKTDRFTRNYKDAATIDDWLDGDEHRMLHLVKEGQVLHKRARSEAKFMWSIGLALAKKYTDSLREEAMKGWAEKLAQGWLPCPPPPGYMTVTEFGKRIHVPNPETRLAMRRVFEMVAMRSFTSGELALEMANMGLVTRNGRPFAKSFVLKTLRNPFYIGVNRFNGVDYPGAQEPLISRELFESVQLKLGRSVSRVRKHNPVFKGMIRCEACSVLVTWQMQKGRYYGMCRQRSDVCRGYRWLREDRVERQVITALSAIEDVDGAILRRLEAAIETARPRIHWESVIPTLEQRLTRLRQMDEALHEDKLAGEISAERYVEKHGEITERIEQLEVRLAEIRQMRAVQKSAIDSEVTNPIVRLYLRSKPDEKRVIMGTLLKPFRLSYIGVSVEALQY